MARQFDRVCEVLTALDYLDGDTVTDRGRHLMRIYSDIDLLAAESLRHGLWDDLPPSELAAALSVLVFEARRPDDARSPRIPGGRGQATSSPRWCGSGPSSTRWSGSTGSTSCASRTSGSPGRPTAGPRATTSTTVLGATDLAAGDFVRWMKQLLDLAGQVADAAGDTPLRETAREVVARLRRGVVAYSSLSE